MNVGDGGEEDGLPPAESKIGELAPGIDCMPVQHGVLSAQRRDEKSFPFESFRRICQRPISDWLSKACALIDAKEVQTKATASMRLTLAAFQRVINSPYTDWIHLPAASHALNAAVNKIGSDFTSNKLASDEKKWLSADYFKQDCEKNAQDSFAYYRLRV